MLFRIEINNLTVKGLRWSRGGGGNVLKVLITYFRPAILSVFGIRSTSFQAN